MRWAFGGVCAAVVASVLALPAAAGPPPAPLHIDQLTAAAGADGATHYAATATDSDPAARLTYTWTLTLEPVDPGAALDPGCNDAALAGGAYVRSSVGLENRFFDVYVWSDHGPAFTWFLDGCNRALFGPSGAQGVVAVVVSDGTWDCTARIGGSAPRAVPDTAPGCSRRTPPAVGGAGVETVARGVARPASFAFGAGTAFVSGARGIFVLRNGRATRVPGLPSAFGLAWHDGTLYGTSGATLYAWRGWNGTRFARTRVVFTAPEALNGVAVGPDGRIYLAVRLDEAFDHAADPTRYAQSVLSLRADGSGLRVVASGLRQPWQIAFAGGSPYVTVLGQDNLGPTEPPDYVVRVRPGQRYGFPACNWSRPAACAGYATPFALLPAHSTPMGIAAAGSTLYVALAGGTGSGPEVVAVPLGGGTPLPVLTGFRSRVRAVGVSDGFLYAADLGGTVYRTRLG